MTRADIIRMAREAGIEWQENMGITGKVHVTTSGSQPVERIERFAALVAAAEREARQKAQAENEELKGVIARHGLEIQHAVLAEREACADIVCQYIRQTNNMEARGCLASVSFDIRTRQTA